MLLFTSWHLWEPPPSGLILCHRSRPISMLVKPQIPPILPDLPWAAGLLWSAEVVKAHCGLSSAYNTSRAALNLDESDPIRLGHHLQHAKTFMLSIVEVLGLQTTNPLPLEYLQVLDAAVSSLVDGLRVALGEATAVLAIIFTIYWVFWPTVCFTVRAPKYHAPKWSPSRGVESGVVPGRSSLRPFSRRPSVLDETSAFRNLPLPSPSTKIHSRHTWPCTRLNDNPILSSQILHLIKL